MLHFHSTCPRHFTVKNNTHMDHSFKAFTHTHAHTHVCTHSGGWGEEEIVLKEQVIITERTSEMEFQQ